MIVLIFGGALYLSGAWYSSLVLQLIFYFLLIAALVYAIISTVRRLLGLGKKKKSGDGSATASKDKKGKKSKKDKSAAVADDTEHAVSSGAREVPAESSTQEGAHSSAQDDVDFCRGDEKPVYYAVKNQPNYIMAEYSDRYELFLKTKKGLLRVRVDYK